MCGICGFVEKKGDCPDIELIRSMMDQLYHRGPDGRGWFRDRKAALGHTRLSIIDLSGGAQPISNEDGSLWVSFNGEIFNYIELKEELIALGHVFKTETDTEVIIHAWESWRENSFTRFNGQWAIALWDRNRDELILCRDRNGIRPLYYTDSNERFLFASEVKSLFADHGVERSFSHQGLQETFTFWGPVASRTVFNNIYELPPGSYGIRENGVFRFYSYWNHAFPKERENPVGLSEKAIKELSYELKDRLVESSKLRFERSDVPVGAYLSGGIDSSICASIVNKYAKEGLTTFSLQFSDVRFDERSFQKQMVNKLGTDHKSITIEPNEIGRVFPDVIRNTERPVLRTAPAPLYLLSKLVRDSGYKVVVTGEGADEVLGGYDIFREAFVRRLIAREGQTERSEKYLDMLYPWMGDTYKKTPAFTRSFFSKNLDLNDPALSHRTRWDNSRLMTPMLSSDMKKFGSDNIVDNLLKSLPDESSDWSYLAKAQWFEYKTLLPGYILSAQGDRMLMANSIEGRFPFLDVNLSDFADSLPSEAKLRTKDLTEKLILKEAFKSEIPNEIIQRSKQPYQSPNSRSFFSGNSHKWIREVTNKEVVEEAGIFEYRSISKLLEKCSRFEGKELNFGDNTRLLAVLSTMLTYNEFIKNKSVVANKKMLNEISFDYISEG